MSRITLYLDRVLHTDVTYIFRNGSWLIASQVVAAGSALLLASVFSRLIDKEVFGQYKFVLSVISLMGMVTLSGMSVAVTRAASQNHDATLVRALQRSLVWNSSVALIALILAGYYWNEGNHILARCFMFFAPIGPLYFSLPLFDAFLNGKQAFQKSALYNMGLNLGSACIVLLAIFLHPSPAILVLAATGGATIMNAFFLFRIFVNYHPSSSTEDPDALQFGRHMTAMNVLATIADQLDKILIFHYLGAIELAVYTFAIAIPEQIKGVLKNAATLMLPKFSNRASTEILATMKRKMLTFLGLVTAIIIAYVLAAPTVYHLLFPAYTEAIPYSQLLTLSLVAVVMNVPYTFFQAKMHTRKLYAYNISAAAILIILLFLLIPQYGLPGAIWATIINRFLNSLIIAYLMRDLFVA